MSTFQRTRTQQERQERKAPDISQVRGRAIRRLLAIAETDERAEASIMACKLLLELSYDPTPYVDPSEARERARAAIQAAFAEIERKRDAKPEEPPPADAGSNGEPRKESRAATPTPGSSVVPVGSTPGNVEWLHARGYDRRGRRISRGY